MKNLIGLFLVITVFASCLFGGVGLFMYYESHIPQKSLYPVAVSSNNSSLDPHEIFSLVNDYRVRNGLKPLIWNNSMCSFANVRLSEIHTDPTHDGYNKNPHPYGTEQDYTGENLAEGYASDQETVTAWINSTEHKSNIISDNFTQTCITSDNFNGQAFVVQEFDSDINSPSPTPDIQKTAMFIANNCAIQDYKSYMNSVSVLIGQGNYTSDVAQHIYSMYVNGRNNCYTGLGIDPNSSTLSLEQMYPPTN